MKCRVHKTVEKLMFIVQIHVQIQSFVTSHYFTNTTTMKKSLSSLLTISYFFLFIFFSKRTLLLNNIPAIIGSLMMFLSYYAKGPALLIIGRVIFGFNNGMCFYVCFLIWKQCQFLDHMLQKECFFASISLRLLYIFMWRFQVEVYDPHLPLVINSSWNSKIWE